MKFLFIMITRGNFSTETVQNLNFPQFIKMKRSILVESEEKVYEFGRVKRYYLHQLYMSISTALNHY